MAVRIYNLPQLVFIVLGNWNVVWNKEFIHSFIHHVIHKLFTAHG